MRNPKTTTLTSIASDLEMWLRHYEIDTSRIVVSAPRNTMDKIAGAFLQEEIAAKTPAYATSFADNSGLRLQLSSIQFKAIEP